jgi:hypothetical protein
MRLRFTILVAAVVAFAGTPAFAAPSVFASSEDAAGAFRTMNGNDLSSELYASGSLPGVTALAIGEVDAASAGPEIVVGRAGTLEVRAGQGYGLLNQRGGFNVINSIAIGDLDTTDPGKVIVVGSTTAGVGRLSVVEPKTAGLPDLGFLVLGFAVEGVAIGNFTTANPNNEVAMAWNWDGASGRQVLVCSFVKGPMAGLTFQNGNLARTILAGGPYNGSVAGDALLVGTEAGQLMTFDGNQAAGAMLVPGQFRAGFGPVTGILVDDVLTSPGLEVVVASNDVGSGAIRITAGNDIMIDLQGRLGLTNVYNGLAAGDVNSSVVGPEIITADTTGGNAVRVLNPATGLSEITFRFGFGTMTSAGAYDPGPVAAVNDWQLY